MKKALIVVMMIGVIGMAGVAEAAPLNLAGAPRGSSTTGWSLWDWQAFDNNTGTRWSSVQNGLPGAQWIWVDLGADYELTTVSVLWQASNATSYTVRLLPEALAGSEGNPAAYTTIGTAVGLNAAEGPPRGDAWEVWNFSTGTVAVPGGTPPGSATVDELDPTGRYLMVHGTVANTTWRNMSIWEINVEAPPVTIGNIETATGGTYLDFEFDWHVQGKPQEAGWDGVFTRNGLTATGTGSGWGFPDGSVAAYGADGVNATGMDSKGNYPGNTPEFQIDVTGLDPSSPYAGYVVSAGTTDANDYGFKWGTVSGSLTTVVETSDVYGAINITNDPGVGNTYAVPIGTLMSDSSGNLTLYFGATGNTNPRTLLDGIALTPGVYVPPPPTYVTYVGNDVDVPGWRTTDVPKPLDADGDNIYGTDGWLRPFGVTNPGGVWPHAVSVSNPSYLTASYISLGAHDRPTGTFVDDGLLSGPDPVADVEAGRVEKYGGTARTTWESDVVQIVVTEDGSFRLGVMTDFITLYAGSDESGPTAIRVRQTSGGNDNSGMIAVPDHNYTADFMFFDIIDAVAGDRFIVSIQSTTNPWGYAQISHITFDTIPPVIPEPAGLGLIGLALLALRKRSRKMKRMLMVVAMAGVIGMAGAQSAFAQIRPVAGTNLDFFDPASWANGPVPDVNLTPGLRWGETLIGDHSMIYDPATNSPGNMVYAVGTAGIRADYYLGRTVAGGSYIFTQESGDLTWHYPTPGRSFKIGSICDGIYVLNAGTARFAGSALSLNSGDAYDSLFDHNAGDVIVTDIISGLQIGNQLVVAVGTATYQIAAGTLQTEMLSINLDGVLNFDAGSTGIVLVNESDKSVTDINDLIGLGKIVDLGSEGFLVTDLGAYTEVKLDLPPPSVIPEPAGLGLIGLALLAVRKRRS